MEFRWVVLIALWTVLSGPVIGVPTGPTSSGRNVAKKAIKPVVQKAVRR